MDNRGNYPVYSANNASPLGYCDTYDYDGRYLTVSVNGIAGKVTILEHQFSLNADRMVLLPKLKNIDIDYISFILEPLLREKTKGRKGENGKNEYTKIDRESILNTLVPIPFNAKGEIDLINQTKIKHKYQRLNEIADGMSEAVDKLLSIDCRFE